LCSHLKAKDRDRTVIGFQVQNEPGILGSDRDYGPEAQTIFDKPVPSKFVNAMKKAGKGRDIRYMAAERAVKIPGHGLKCSVGKAGSS
jgi:hypothetical protein